MPGNTITLSATEANLALDTSLTGTIGTVKYKDVNDTDYSSTLPASGISDFTTYTATNPFKFKVAPATGKTIDKVYYKIGNDGALQEITAAADGVYSLAYNAATMEGKTITLSATAATAPTPTPTPATATVKVADGITGGTVAITSPKLGQDGKYAIQASQIVTFTVTAESDYTVDKVEIIRNKEPEVINPEVDGSYKYVVPSNLVNGEVITIKATFTKKDVKPDPQPEVKDGWAKTEDGNWTYTVNGELVTGWKNDIPGWEGQWFYFDANGIMQTGWKNDISGWEGQWFYFDVNTGVMATGWQTNIPGWGANWFYFDVNTGVMATGWQTNIPGWGTNWFYFNTTTGTMFKNQYTPNGYYVDANGCWDGQPAKNN